MDDTDGMTGIWTHDDGVNAFLLRPLGALFLYSCTGHGYLCPFLNMQQTSGVDL